MSKTVKLVIEIPKEQYEYLAKIADIGEEPLGYFERVIMCGTPLDDVLQALDKSYAPPIIEADKESVEPHECNTCKFGMNYENGYDTTTLDDECGGCCSWNDKWQAKEDGAE